MIELIDLETVKNIGGFLIAGLLGGVMILRKFVRNYKEEGIGISTADAKVSVIELMRGEVERMSKINLELSVQLGELRQENTLLRGEINSLKDKIGELNIEFDRMSEHRCINCGASFINKEKTQ